MRPASRDPIRGIPPLAARAPLRPGLWPARITAALCFSVPLAMLLHVVLPWVAGRPELADLGPHSLYLAGVALLIGTALSLYALRAH